MQSTVTAIIREGDEGTLPTEIQKEIWGNLSQFKKDFQSLWYLVNFPYDLTNSKAMAFVLTIGKSLVYIIYRIIVLGLNHNGTIVCLLEHKNMGPTEGKQMSNY